jgi:hypothetical protein
MRFGNSSNYFGLESNDRSRMPLKAATGRAFHAFAKGIAGPLTTLDPERRIFTAINSAVTICSKVTTAHVETASLAAVQGAKRRV